MKVAEYIQESPGKMLVILERAEEIFSKVKKESFDKIIITGSGTSHHAALQTREYLQDKMKIEVEVLYPFMITETFFEVQEHKILFIGISQGGSSYSTYNAMKIAQENGCTIASMAGTENALIDEIADYVLTVHCGPEDAGPKTKGFHTTKLHLMLFALYVAEQRGLLNQDELDKQFSNAHSTIEKFSTVCDKAEKWVRNHQNVFAKTKDLRVISTADLYGDALESALKLLETLRIPVTGYEFEEFIHGIYNAMNENSTLIIIDSGREIRMKQLTKVLGEWTEQIFIISTKESGDSNELILPLEKENPFDEMLYIIAVQLICALVPELKGINPLIPKDPSFHKKLDSKRL